MPGTTTRTHTAWCQDIDHPEADCSSPDTVVSGIHTFLLGTPGEVVAVIGGIEMDGPTLDALTGRLTELRAQLHTQTHPVESLPSPRTAP